MSGTMVRKAYVLKVDGTTEDIGHRPTLAEGQKAVGGYVEAMVMCLCRTPNLTVYGDEDGRPNGKAVNRKASDLLGYEAVGDILVLEGWRSLA